MEEPEKGLIKWEAKVRLWGIFSVRTKKGKTKVKEESSGYTTAYFSLISRKLFKLLRMDFIKTE